MTTIYVLTVTFCVLAGILTGITYEVVRKGGTFDLTHFRPTTGRHR